MKIGELAERSGLSTHTIRYYEKIGLLTYASRNQGNHREYDESIFVWIEFIGRLKASGMPIKEILQYAELRESGLSTEQSRLNLLRSHRDRVIAHLNELNDCLQILDKKIIWYTDSLKRNKQYDENLPRRNRKPPGSGAKKAIRN